MANSTVDTLGIVRASGDVYNSPQGSEIQMNYNNRGDQLIAFGLPSRAELARMGVMWTMRTATASTLVALIGLPTTTGGIGLYNGEPTGGKSYVIDSAWAANFDTSFAAVNQFCLVGQLIPASVVTVPTNSLTTTLISSANGKASYGGFAKRAISVTTVADYWSVLAQSVTTTAAATMGLTAYADLWGGFIVPPGAMFAVSAASGIATGHLTYGLTWAEVTLALG